MMLSLHQSALFKALMVAGLALFAGQISAQGPELAMLDRLTPGQWELRTRDGTPPQKLCIKNGRDLIQIRHKGAACQHYVIEDRPSAITVQYSCPKDGYGRIAIRRETDRLVRITGQGLKANAPYAFTAEGRMIGACTT